MIGDNQCERAITDYQQAANIYQQHNDPVTAAQSQIGAIGALYLLGRYDEAIALGHTLRPIFEQHQQGDALTRLLLNLANIHHRLGQGQQSLALLNHANQICIDSGAEQELPGIELNRANIYGDLGDLESALRMGQQAEKLFQMREQLIGVAQTQMSQGTTRFLRGEYNQALALFEKAREIYIADGRSRDAILLARYISDLFLQVGRFADVLQKSGQIQERYGQDGVQHEVAHALINQAIAHAGMRQYPQAHDALDKAHKLANNPLDIATIDLEKAGVFYWQGEMEQCLQTAVSTLTIFQNNPLKQAQAQLLAARAAISLQDWPQAEQLADLPAADSPWLRYQLAFVRGQLANGKGDGQTAVTHYQQAINLLEQLRGKLMVEFRADFLADKNRVYEEIVSLYLQQNEPAQALQYVEHTKSRALIDLLAHRLDLRIQPRDSSDKQLVAQLEQLRDRRNQLLRRWQADAELAEDGRFRLNQLEKTINDLWHKLLIHNADYARDASVHTIRTEPIQPHLDEETLLLEYFLVKGEFIVFLVSHNEIRGQHLPNSYRQVVRASRFLQLNLKAVPTGSAKRLLPAAQKQLRQLHQLLIAPIAEDCRSFAKLIIVPHTAVLHYLPFHALYDGSHYLIEQFEISYLPAASLLHYQKRPSTNKSVVTVGYSCDGRLPHAPQEATAVAQLFNGIAHTEQAATLAQIQQSGTQTQLLHLATHGDFNQENPLFSGLTLADGHLSTLDIFNMQLPASLITLSACQTGRSVVRGGDELLGLMRACLYAGASSLLLSLWRVADDSTMDWMLYFYQQLADGFSKGAALQNTQLYFCRLSNKFAHPYYWAPFFLVGDNGKI